VASVGVLIFNLPGGGAVPDQLTDGHTPITGTPTPVDQGLAAEAALREQAISWILAQVSRAAIVSCDPRVCMELGNKGFPSADLETLGPTSTDPLGSDLVVATATIRAQFDGRLANVYAPAIIASFGSGNARIDIRLVYPGGTANYRVVEEVTLRARKAADAQLLANSRINVSAAADVPRRHGRYPPGEHRGLRQSIAWRRTCQPAAVGGRSHGGQRGASDTCRIPALDASVHRRADSPVPPRLGTTGIAEYWRSRAEDRVQRAEPG